MADSSESALETSESLDFEESESAPAEDIVEKVTWGDRFWFFFDWVPLLRRLGLFRWCIGYFITVFLVFGYCFKAWLFWMKIKTGSRLSFSENDIENGTLSRASDVILQDWADQSMNYDAMVTALYLIFNGTTIHVSKCFWCTFNEGHFWGGVMFSGVVLTTWAFGAIIVSVCKWAFSFCDDNILSERKKQIRLAKKKEEAQPKRWTSGFSISGPHFPDALKKKN